MIHPPVKTNRPFFLLTSAHPHYGSAHLERSLKLLNLLSYKNKKPLPILLYKTKPNNLPYPSFSRVKPLIKHLAEKNCKLLILDKRESPLTFLRQIKRKGIHVMAFDTSGPERTLIDYVIETLPSLHQNHSNNLSGLGYLPSPMSISSQKPYKASSHAYHCLVYLSSPSKQSYLKKVGACLLHIHHLTGKPLEVTCITHPHKPSLLPKIRSSLQKPCSNTPIHLSFIPKTPSLSALFPKIHLFICHYGLSAFEALQAKIFLLLLSPSRTHKRLTQKHLSPFHYEPNKITSLAALEQKQQTFLQQNPIHIGNQFPLIPKIILSFLQSKPSFTSFRCPICSNNNTHVRSRSPWYNLVQCRKCQGYHATVFPFAGLFIAPSETYPEGYFTTQYQNQYGKTYAQDQPHLSLLARKRILTLLSFQKKNDRTLPMHLFEIGPAYGYFLDEAKQNGFTTEGAEISQHATAIASQNHPIHHGNFLHVTPNAKTYDAFALWYVIEHFQDIHALIKKMSSYQKKGGIIAFSTPNAKGFSARFDTQAFLKSSPKDHFFIFTKRMARTLFKPYGYKLMKIEYTGLHYSRFQARFSRLAKGLTKTTYLRIAKALGWGDTFDLYFMKK